MSFKSKKPLWKNKFILLAAPLVIVAIALGVFLFISSDEEERTSPKTTVPTTQAPIIAPLTGLVDPSGETLSRPALAVKIGNNPEARPQAGINQADIMYEEIVEGGVTRYLGVYHSQVPEKVGPVRSVRGMDPNILLNWGGIFAYSGGATHNENKVQNTQGILALNETQAGQGMRRESNRRAPNNLYAIPSILFTRDASPIPPVAQFKYSQDVNPSAEPASVALIGFSAGFASTWTFDQETNRYLRSYGTRAVLDQGGEQTAYDNVVVQFISYPSESEGVTTGNGDVWVFRNGTVTKGSWDRPTTNAPAVFRDILGNEIELMPGRTWVALASITTAVTVTP